MKRTSNVTAIALGLCLLTATGCSPKGMASSSVSPSLSPSASVTASFSPSASASASPSPSKTTVSYQVPKTCNRTELVAIAKDTIASDSVFIAEHWSPQPGNYLETAINNKALQCTYGLPASEAGMRYWWFKSSKSFRTRFDKQFIAEKHTIAITLALGESEAYFQYLDGAALGAEGYSLWTVAILLDDIWVYIESFNYQSLADGNRAIQAAVAEATATN